MYFFIYIYNRTIFSYIYELRKTFWLAAVGYPHVFGFLALNSPPIGSVHFRSALILLPVAFPGFLVSSCIWQTATDQ